MLSYAYAYCDLYADGDVYAYIYCDVYADSYGNIYAYTYGNVYSNPDSDPDIDGRVGVPGRELLRSQHWRGRSRRHLDRIQPVPGAQRQQLWHQRRRLAGRRAQFQQPDRQ